jgi:hypothetical protein
MGSHYTVMVVVVVGDGGVICRIFQVERVSMMQPAGPVVPVQPE